MKKYLLSTVAVVLATMTFALRAKKETTPRSTHFFQYVGPNYSAVAVKTPANWMYSSTAPACPNVSQKACSIVVPDSLTVFVDGDRYLQSYTNILVQQYPVCGSYYVTPCGDVLFATNKPCY